MKTLVIVGLAVLCACSSVPTSDQQQNAAMETLNQQAVNAVGMPGIHNFFEKRMLKTIYELRDNSTLATITYVQDLYGKLHKRCDSIGYGIPYATEYTNPSQAVDLGSASGVTAIAQADPNGLYSPSSAAGTWVLCLNPKTKQAVPTYFEQDVTVSQFELPND